METFWKASLNKKKCKEEIEGILLEHGNNSPIIS